MLKGFLSSKNWISLSRETYDILLDISWDTIKLLRLQLSDYYIVYNSYTVFTMKLDTHYGTPSTILQYVFMHFSRIFAFDPQKIA